MHPVVQLPMDMGDLRLRCSRKRNNKDSGISCRAFFDKQLNYDLTAIFWHRRFFEFELLRSCKTCYTESVAQHGRPDADQVQDLMAQDFHSVARRVGRQVAITIVLEQWLMGAIATHPECHSCESKNFVGKMHEY